MGTERVMLPEKSSRKVLKTVKASQSQEAGQCSKGGAVGGAKGRSAQGRSQGWREAWARLGEAGLKRRPKGVKIEETGGGGPGNQEGWRGPKGGHSGEEPEGGVTQRKTAGWCWRWAGPRDGAQTNPWGAVPEGCGRDQVGRSRRSFHFKGPRCVV